MQCKVHLRGQISDIEILMNNNHSELSNLAIEALQNSPAWIPASVNGHNVVCYKYLSLILSLKKPSGLKRAGN
jgi:hypothetical protein